MAEVRSSLSYARWYRLKSPTNTYRPGIDSITSSGIGLLQLPPVYCSEYIDQTVNTPSPSPKVIQHQSVPAFYVHAAIEWRLCI